MGFRMHTATVYDVQYRGSDIPREISETIFDFIRRSDTGYISEDEIELEIDKKEFVKLKDQLKPKDKNIVDKIIEEADPHNEFIHFSYF